MKNAMLTMISLEMELKLRSVSMLSLHIVPRSMNRSTTTLTLLKENLKLLMLISKDMVMEMVTMSSVRKPRILQWSLLSRQEGAAVPQAPQGKHSQDPKQTCKNIVDTIYIETCEEGSIHSVRKHMREVTTALVLLLMILKLLLLHHILDTRNFMGEAIRIC